MRREAENADPQARPLRRTRQDGEPEQVRAARLAVQQARYGLNASLR